MKNYEYLGGGAPGDNPRTNFIMADGSYFMFTSLYKNPDSLSTENCAKAKSLGGTLCEIAIAILYIDVNGEKLPNQFGRDLFQFTVSNDGRLLPAGGKDKALFDNQSELSSNSYYWRSSSASSSYKCEKGSSGYACAARIIENGWVMDY